MTHDHPYKNNSCKYNLVKDRLIQSLEAGMSARDCAKDLGISIATVNRYKCCLSAELGKVFPVQDELRFIERQRIKFAHMQEVVTQSAPADSPEKSQPVPRGKSGGKK